MEAEPPGLERANSTDASANEAASGGSGSETRQRRDRQKRDLLIARRRVAQRSLLDAKRSGELQALADEWNQARSAMVSSTSGLQDLQERVKGVIRGADADAELDSVDILASEVRKKADDFQQLRERAERSVEQMKRAGELGRLENEMRSKESSAKLPTKERALRSLLEMKRSGELENLAQEMADMQAKLETKAIQLQAIAVRMRHSLLDAKRSGELQRLAAEMETLLQAKMQTIRRKARRSLLRAHRTGELQELRSELDEYPDGLASLPPPRSYGPSKGRRWCDIVSGSSDSDDARYSSMAKGSPSSSPIAAAKAAAAAAAAESQEASE